MALEWLLPAPCPFPRRPSDDPVPFPAPPATGFAYLNTVAFADFTGDGRGDSLTELHFFFSGTPGFVEMRMLADDGLGKYVDLGVTAPPFVQFGQPDDPPDEHWEAADADEDGDVDLLVDGGYWRNTGAGYLDAFVTVGPGRLFGAADVDGDGDVDLLARRKVGATSEILIQRNLGGSYTPVTLGSLAGDALARFVDLDADGDLDVAAADPNGDELLLVQDTGGAFGPAVVLAASVENLRMLGVTDTNGDGVTDLLTLRKTSQGMPWTITLMTEYRRTGPGLDYVKASETLLGILPGGGYDGFADVDGDGDLDLTGSTTLLNLTVQAPAGGVVQQFGAGFPGSGGVAPVLGAQGPVTSTNPDSEMRIVQALGGSLGFLVFSQTEIAMADFPFAGMTLYVGAPVITGPYALGGAPGHPGAGSLALPLPTLPFLHGLTFVHQAFALDPGSITGWTASNGLRITYGL